MSTVDKVPFDGAAQIPRTPDSASPASKRATSAQTSSLTGHESRVSVPPANPSLANAVKNASESMPKTAKMPTPTPDYPLERIETQNVTGDLPAVVAERGRSISNVGQQALSSTAPGAAQERTVADILVEPDDDGELGANADTAEAVMARMDREDMEDAAEQMLADIDESVAARELGPTIDTMISEGQHTISSATPSTPRERTPADIIYEPDDNVELGPDVGTADMVMARMDREEAIEELSKQGKEIRGTITEYLNNLEKAQNRHDAISAELKQATQIKERGGFTTLDEAVEADAVISRLQNERTDLEGTMDACEQGIEAAEAKIRDIDVKIAEQKRLMQQ